MPEAIRRRVAVSDCGGWRGWRKGVGAGAGAAGRGCKEW